jgi:hypothetical protein
MPGILREPAANTYYGQWLRVFWAESVRFGRSIDRKALTLPTLSTAEMITRYADGST